MENEKSTALAMSSMVLGIISIFLGGLIGVFSVSFPTAGLLLGVISIRENCGERKKAIAGVTMSLIGMFLMIVSTVIAMVLIWKR